MSDHYVTEMTIDQFEWFPDSNVLISKQAFEDTHGAGATLFINLKVIGRRETRFFIHQAGTGHERHQDGYRHCVFFSKDDNMKVVVRRV